MLDGIDSIEYKMKNIIKFKFNLVQVHSNLIQDTTIIKYLLIIVKIKNQYCIL